MSGALAAHLAELLVLELALDLLEIFTGEIVGAFANTALQAQIIVLGHGGLFSWTTLSRTTDFGNYR